MLCLPRANVVLRASLPSRNPLVENHCTCPGGDRLRDSSSVASSDGAVPITSVVSTSERVWQAEHRPKYSTSLALLVVHSSELKVSVVGAVERHPPGIISTCCVEAVNILPVTQIGIGENNETDI